ncbi:MAG TPA: efflux RND transporter permease subunit [Solirubrobacterales bacterium]|nr:efflux RND transporter permease subunit [Solirubrobacterales bacterium]
MKSITLFSLRHRRLVALAWIALTVVGVLTVSSATGALTHSQAAPGTAGYDANEHLKDRFGLDGHEQPTIAVLHLPAGQGMSTARGRAIAAKTFAAANQAGHLGVADYANTQNRKLVSADTRTTWALIDMPNPDEELGTGVMERIEPALRAAAPAGTSVEVTGYEQLQSAGGGGGGPSVLVETLIGAAGALVILAFVFASWVAVLPLLMAIPSILTTFVLVLGLTKLTEVSFLAQYLVALIGLGVTIDYSLLIVTRWREERERGLDNEEAVLAAGSTAGRAVVLSGLTVAIGLFSLVVLPVAFLRSVGFAGFLIPLVAMSAAITLLPAALAAWGPALDARRVRKGSATFSRPWERWGRLVVRRRWLAGFAGLAILIALAVPALSINLAEPSANALAASGPTAAKAFEGLEEEGVPSAVVFPVQMLVHGGSTSARVATAIAAATPGVYTVLAPETSSFRRGDAAMISVIPEAEGNTSQGEALIPRLRERLATVSSGVEVGGNTAANVDFDNAVYGNFWLMLLVIGALTFLLLARAFRSVVLAVKAVIMNLLSLGAAYGFLVLFWQEGHGAGLIYGVPAVGAIKNWIPIVVFAFLFGLSMDYEVFVLSRIREEYDRTGSTEKAIVGAMARTGRLVTCAALILAISFLSLSTSNDIIVRIIATGLAFGIVIDVLVVRTLVVPALVALMGRWNWWMPTWIAWALRLGAPTHAISE